MSSLDDTYVQRASGVCSQNYHARGSLAERSNAAADDVDFGVYPIDDDVEDLGGKKAKNCGIDRGIEWEYPCHVTISCLRTANYPASAPGRGSRRSVVERLRVELTCLSNLFAAQTEFVQGGVQFLLDFLGKRGD